LKLKCHWNPEFPRHAYPIIQAQFLFHLFLPILLSDTHP